jgi:hypothetical protein
MVLTFIVSTPTPVSIHTFQVLSLFIAKLHLFSTGLSKFAVRKHFSTIKLKPSNLLCFGMVILIALQTFLLKSLKPSILVIYTSDAVNHDTHDVA